MNTSSNLLTVGEAYLAMYDFLLAVWNRTQDDEIGNLLGDMSLLQNGHTADPASWSDWLKCVDRAKRGEVDALLHINPPG